MEKWFAKNRKVSSWIFLAQKKKEWQFLALFCPTSVKLLTDLSHIFPFWHELLGVFCGLICSNSKEDRILRRIAKLLYFCNFWPQKSKLTITNCHFSFAEKVQVLEARILDEKITLNGLACYQNYSIRVAASTKAGDGLLSRSIYCRTKEDCKFSILWNNIYFQRFQIVIHI